MCIQCAATAATAATAVGGAAGLRVWLRARAWAWLTPGRMRGATIGLVALAVTVSGLGLSG
jgi:hypothetical protein